MTVDRNKITLIVDKKRAYRMALEEYRCRKKWIGEQPKTVDAGDLLALQDARREMNRNARLACDLLLELRELGVETMSLPMLRAKRRDI